LILDDNSVNIRVLENRIRKIGHSILVTRDGQQCYERYVQNHYVVDFILMDIEVGLMFTPVFSMGLPNSF
jgi:CheY-like chemotaxis protein